jgi:hypothetical protein
MKDVAQKGCFANDDDDDDDDDDIQHYILAFYTLRF